MSNPNWPYYDPNENSWDSMIGIQGGCGEDTIKVTPTTNKFTPTTNRFDLEQEILNCWRIVDDLKILNEAVLEQDADRDKISNILTGLADLYEMKFNKTFEIFEECIRQRKI